MSRPPARPRQEITGQHLFEAAGFFPVAGDPQVLNPAITSLASRARRPRRHRLLGLATLVMAVGASLILPVAGTLAVAGLLTLLRAADRARQGPVARRIARWPRARDVLLLAGSIPWALARSVMETALLAPLLLAAAGLAAAGGADARPSVHALSAWAAVAAAYTILSCLGPGSRRARRELNRAFDVLSSAPLSAAMTVLTLATLATTIASLVLVKTTPPLWPLPGLHTIHMHVPDLRPADLHW